MSPSDGGVVRVDPCPGSGSGDLRQRRAWPCLPRHSGPAGSTAPVRRSRRPARAQAVPTFTRKGMRQEQSCKDRTSRPVNRAILLRLGRHVPHPRRRPLWRSPPGVTSSVSFHGALDGGVAPRLPGQGGCRCGLLRRTRHTRHLAESPD
ncbi:hypothetical protein VPH35_023874 [Triticum aestivum]